MFSDMEGNTDRHRTCGNSMVHETVEGYFLVGLRGAPWGSKLGFSVEVRADHLLWWG